jgi:iron(III) transport system substrate-binding protein
MKRDWTYSLAGAALAALALFFNPAPAAAQAKPFASLDEMADYKGADRTARLLEGAKKEGTLSMYTSAQGDDMGALVAAFEKKYGVKVSMFRTSSD